MLDESKPGPATTLSAGPAVKERVRSKSAARHAVAEQLDTNTALDLAIQNYQERPLTFGMARTPSSGCSFTITAVIQPGLVGGSSGFRARR